VKASSRYVLRIVGVLGALASGASPALAQRQATPQTGPRLMVPAFAGPKPLGVQLADQLREKLKTDYQVKTIWTVPKTDINGILEASGFRTDTSLNNADLKELARAARADEILMGRITKTATGVRVEPRLVLPRDLAIGQPLPPVEAKSVGDAAKVISKEVANVRKQLAAYNNCETRAREGKYAEAIAAANAGNGAYGTATLTRICALNAYLAMKAPADTIYAHADEILKFDPRNRIALNAAAQALSDQSDAISATNKPRADSLSDKAVELWTTLISADASDTRMLETVIRKIVVSANPAVAVPIIDASVQDNPGNLQLLRLQWLIHLAAKDFKGAVGIGRNMVQLDTSLADTTYYTRQVAALASNNQSAEAAQMAAEGLKKFPTNTGLQSVYAQTLKGSGNLQGALTALRNAVATNPKLEHAYLQIAQIQLDLNQPDSAIASLKQAIATHNDSASFVAQYALGTGNTSYKTANAMKVDTPESSAAKRAAFQKALMFLTLSDSLAPSATAKFLIGVSSFTVGQLAATDAPKAKSCDLATMAQSAFNKAQVNLVAGGATAPDAAKQYLGYLQQFVPVVERQVKTFCKGSNNRRSR
jgi:tetratricopeptide repeat protein